MFMKYFWNGVNTSLIFMVFMYVFLTKDFNTKAYDKCIELEKKVELQEERCNHFSDIAAQKDTIVVNVKNYNHYYHYEKNSK